MARVRIIQHVGEALVLRTWPFGEADLLVSLLTREQGVVKGIARHALRSRRRFGGTLEPGTHVTARYAERPREDLMRLDSFEILWSPLRGPASWLRTAGMQLVLEVLEQVLPEQAPEDNVFRLALAVLQGMEGRGTEPPQDAVAAAVTYFSVWMCRLMGWWPELGACAACGLDLRGRAVWWSRAADGVSCEDDRRPDAEVLQAASVADAAMLLRMPVSGLLREGWTAERTAALLRYALALLERHMDRRLRSAAGLLAALRQGRAGLRRGDLAGRRPALEALPAPMGILE